MVWSLERYIFGDGFEAVDIGQADFVEDDLHDCEGYRCRDPKTNGSTEASACNRCFGA